MYWRDGTLEAEMTNIKQHKLIAPSVDPIDAALTELKRIPQSQRFERGQPHLRTIIEEVLKRPNQSAAVEDAALLCGKTVVEAMDLRVEVERAAQKPEAQPPSSIVKVQCDPEIIERQRRDVPRSIHEYDPFSPVWMRR
jgi:hypothetical protein